MSLLNNKEGSGFMNKKAMIGVGVGSVVVVAVVTGGIVNGWFYKEKPTNGNDVVNPSQNVELKNDDGSEEKYVGEPLPNIVNRAGTIKKINKNAVIINGPEDEDIVIYVLDDTKIYGADGKERELKDLKKGMYITADIDGDKADSDTYFDAMIIYISGK